MNTKSLNTIATFIAGRLNESTNMYLIEEIKYAVKYWRNFLIKQQLDRGIINPKNIQFFTVALTKAPTDDCNAILINNCKVSRTITKVPFPVVGKNNVLFNFVGDKFFKTSYSQEYPETLIISTSSRFTGKSIKYYYNDGYIYVYGNKYIKEIGVRAILENPEDIYNLCSNSTTCYTDDESFPIEDSMLQTIITGLLSKEFSITIPNDQEIKITDAKN